MLWRLAKQVRKPDKRWARGHRLSRGSAPSESSRPPRVSRQSRDVETGPLDGSNHSLHGQFRNSSHALPPRTPCTLRAAPLYLTPERPPATVGQTYFGETPLHVVASQAHTALAQLLLKHPSMTEIAVQARDSAGRTPLFLAAFFSRREIVQLLLLQVGRSCNFCVRTHTASRPSPLPGP